MKKIILFVFICLASNFHGSNDSLFIYKIVSGHYSRPVPGKKPYTKYDILLKTIGRNEGDTMNVTTHYFHNNRPGKSPLLIIVPPIQGISKREKKVTDHFLKQGYHVAVLEPVKDITDSSITIKGFRDQLICFINAVKCTVDAFSEKEEVDEKNIFIWATSMGAIYSSIEVCLDPRINSAILIVGGSSIADIVTESKQKYVVRYKTTRMKKEHLKTEDEFRQKLKQSIGLDVSMYSKERSSSDFFFVMALKDKTVPTKYQVELYNSLHAPENVVRYKGGHAKALMRSHLFNINKYSTYTNSRLKK